MEIFLCLLLFCIILYLLIRFFFFIKCSENDTKIISNDDIIVHKYFDNHYLIYKYKLQITRKIFIFRFDFYLQEYFVNYKHKEIKRTRKFNNINDIECFLRYTNYESTY